MSDIRFVATFTAQAWLSGHAISVDPQGDTDWDVTATIKAMPIDSVLRHDLNRADPYDDVLDREDVLRADPNAPEWTRKWSGPFDITIRREPA